MKRLSLLFALVILIISGASAHAQTFTSRMENGLIVEQGLLTDTLTVTGTTLYTGAATFSAAPVLTNGLTFATGKGITNPTAGNTAILGSLITINDTYGVLNTTMVVNGNLDVATGGKIKANGTQAAAITNASTAHALNAVFSDTEVEAALNALGTKINSALAAIRGVGIVAP